MLSEFLTQNYDELIRRCRAKVAARSPRYAFVSGLEYGIPRLLDQLSGALRLETEAKTDATASEDAVATRAIGSTAGKHGNVLLQNGYTIDQVVHDYGDLCQAVTELALETNTPISVDEFHTFNRCLDNAIAGAVSEFGRERDKLISEEGGQSMNEQLGFLAHELRNLLNTAMQAFNIIRNGNVALTGATGAVLDRSLTGLGNLIDRTLADVRLTAGLQARFELVSIGEFIEEIRVSAAMEAKRRSVVFTTSVEENLHVRADRPMLSSALSNLLQNAFKFTRPSGHVFLTVHKVGESVIIDVQDQCGGLPPGKSEELFASFAQRNTDRSGLGLGLSISRRSVESNGGTLSVANVENDGCIFTISLPRYVQIQPGLTP